MMNEDNSLYMSCRYRTGNWVSDRQLGTWCIIKENVNCDGVFEYNDYKSEVVIRNE